ncbi:SDR family oxidoreductase [Streptomyces sp. XM83C]|jgi:NAD(P)-dependent dehydrogenase (short-subunit alcohol dehydrogenase family)|uniref:SDR family NAD(P)-dependent oxidoreductase n=1 Tax=Streptomyces thermocoprophilus TaxID=78356 RepID=A0ABV5VG53_9ACTN|nr:SDR family oxidoreductase [Streptomyces sp. XM83C]MCK1821565.1 SDR family oxidoreductase [Streptomyces sp. XM83C]
MTDSTGKPDGTEPSGRPVAVVTGGARGIGRAVARRLTQEGYDVEFTYLSSKRAADELTEATGGLARGHLVDGRDADQVRQFVDTVAATGRLQALVNNQGLTVDRLVNQVTWPELEQVLDTNLGSAVTFTHAALPHLVRRRRGDIVFISSQARRNARVGNAMYGVSKAALTRYAANIALEGARFNVFANVVEPGFVETDLTRTMLDGKDRRKYLQEIPLRRFTNPRDVAQVVAALVTRSPELVGAVLPVAGGAQL